MKIAFDIDDTLIIPSVATGLDRDTPNYETIAIYRWFQAQGHEMYLWSGSGIDWAKTWGEKLGLVPFTVIPKQKHYEDPASLCRLAYIDVAFDDCDVDLAKVNIKIKRLNNGISRADWNRNKKMS